MDAELIELLNKYANVPVNSFSTVPEKSSIPVRRFTFALEGLIAQQKLRYRLYLVKVFDSFVYKNHAAQRHQGFWKSFRHLHGHFRKLMKPDLLSFLNSLHKKMSAFSSFFYLPTPETISYISAAFLTQLYHLHKIRKLALEVTNQIMGQIELSHWERLSLFIVAFCAELSYDVTDHTKRIVEAYKGFAEFAQLGSKSFPSEIDFLSIVLELLNRGKIDEVGDTEKVLQMIDMDSTDLEEANIGQEMKKLRSEISMNLQLSSEDLGVSIARDEEVVEKPSFRRPIISSTDSAFVSDLDSTMTSDVFIESTPIKGKRKKGKFMKNSMTIQQSTSTLDISEIVEKPAKMPKFEPTTTKAVNLDVKERRRLKKLKLQQKAMESSDDVEKPTKKAEIREVESVELVEKSVQNVVINKKKKKKLKKSSLSNLQEASKVVKKKKVKKNKKKLTVF